MIYDAFLYLNEADLCEIRFRELDAVVDKFVVVEANRSFTYNPKPFHFLKNQERFAPWRDKIIHVAVRDVPECATPFEREAFNRNCILRGLSGAKRGDVILASDVDEIPRASTVAAYRSFLGVCGFRQTMYRYYLNCATGERWIGTKAIPWELMKAPDFHRWNDHGQKFLENGGWHFTSTGGADAFAYKVASFAHAGKPWHPDEVQGIRDGTLIDKVRRESGLRVVPIDDTYPKFVQDNPELMERWGLIYREPGLAENGDALVK